MGTCGMRLYDAMARGISLLEQRPAPRRRILVVVGEAQDTGSENKLGEVLRMAHLANVTIYSIGLEHRDGGFARAGASSKTADFPRQAPIPFRLPMASRKRPTSKQECKIQASTI